MLKLKRVTIENNTSDFFPSAMYVENFQGTLSVSESTFTANTKGVSTTGLGSNDDESFGTVHLSGSGQGTIEKSTVNANSNNTGSGGGIHIDMAADIVNTTVTGNYSALSGGGLFVNAPSAAVNVSHSTIVDNLAGNPMDNTVDAGGGGISFVTVDNAVLSHTIVADNLDQSPIGVVANDLDLLSEPSQPVSLVADYNIIGSISGPIAVGDLSLSGGFSPTGTNINTAPNLMPLDNNGGATLTRLPNVTSPAIDAGEPQFVGPPDVDQRNYERIVDGNGDEIVVIDIGAVEFNSTPSVTADFDEDGDVDGIDFLLWQDGFGIMQNATRMDGDADGDGDVDLDDLAIWAEQYGQGTTISADFDGDGSIDNDDLDLWEQSFGQNNTADADNDSDSDVLDLLAWQIQFLQETDTLDEIVNLADTLQHLGDSNQLVVSLTTDENDTNKGFDDLSLREAVILANAATVPTTIVLPTGRYSLTRVGTEAGDASYNDLDVTGDVTIQGDGAGFSIIDSTALTGSDGRAFHLNTATAKLRLDSLTIANGASASNGQGVYVESGDSLEIYDSAIVNHEGWSGGSGVAVTDAEVTIHRSVFTHNDNTSPNPGATGAALTVFATTSGSASLTLGQTIFAYNVQANGSQHAVWTNSSVTKTNEGDNLYDTAAGGFFDTTPGTGDHLGTPDYVVTSVADTFDQTDNDEALSLREAVALANTNSGAEEIWLPAWHFELTRDRATYGGGSTTDTDVAFGDIDISDSVTLRGVSAALTNVAWQPGTTEDEAFKLLGDYDGDGGVDEDLVSQYDYQYWYDDNGSTGGYEDYHTDGNEDGVVDNDDYSLWQSMLYNSLTKHNLSIG